MKRRRTRKSFDKFPTPDVDQTQLLEDVRNREYLSKFTEFHVRTVFYFALLGMTEAQMAVALDVELGTFQVWKKKHQTFRDAIKNGKEQADANMVYSLYQAGIGYEHESEQIFCSKEKIFGKDSNGRTVLLKEVPKIVHVPITKRYPPDVKAALRWLEIRQPGIWSQKVDQNKKLTLIQNNNYDVKGLSLEELKVLQKIGLNTNPVDDNFFHTTAQKALKEINV